MKEIRIDVKFDGITDELANTATNEAAVTVPNIGERTYITYIGLLQESAALATIN